MAARDPIIGRTIADRYRVEARIGRGGFGAVYRATHLGLDRPVALKVMHGDGGDDLGQRFRREARLQASLRHPVCVIVFDYGEDDGDPWLVQEFVTGHELKAVLAAEGRLPPERAVAITCRLLEGLAAAHDSGIVHRDIKPSNIMLVRDGDREDVRLLDFGIARAMAEEETSLTSPVRSSAPPATSPPSRPAANPRPGQRPLLGRRRPPPDARRRPALPRLRHARSGHRPPHPRPAPAPRRRASQARRRRRAGARQTPRRPPALGRRDDRPPPRRDATPGRATARRAANRRAPTRAAPPLHPRRSPAA
ncbi:MAG: serine/threonine-protein kinase [bacterium]